MGILDLFRRGKTSPELPTTFWEDLPPETALPLWNDADGILLTDQHLSTPGTYIICEVKYVPSGRNVLCRTRLPDEEPGDFSRLTVPQEISAADGLMTFLKNSGSGAWFMTGYTMPEHVKAALDRVL